MRDLIEKIENISENDVSARTKEELFNYIEYVINYNVQYGAGDEKDAKKALELIKNLLENKGN